MVEATAADLAALSDDDLAVLRALAEAEVQRRADLRSLPQAVSDLARRFLEVSGEVPGGLWRRPSGAHDAYPEGWWVVDEAGRAWVSRVPVNVVEPGGEGWEQVPDPDAPDPDPEPGPDEGVPDESAPEPEPDEPGEAEPDPDEGPEHEETW